MSARAASLTAAERQEPLLQFLCCKKLDYGTRSNLVLALAAVGVVLQGALLSVWPGLPFIAAALLLSWVVGFDNRVDLRGYRAGAGWESCGVQRIDEIVTLDRKMRRWDASAFDFTSPAGAALYFLLLAGIGIVTFLLARASAAVAWIFAVDALLLLAFQWFNGMRTVQRQPDLVLQAKHLADVARALRLDGAAGGALGAQLLMRGQGDDRAPAGVKLTVTFPDGPKHFFGLQCQVVLNRVQGKPYPYCYAVLVGEAGHGLLERTARMSLPSRVVRSAEQKDGVDVVVVRQTTTKTSGYHTSPSRSREIVQAALDAAEAYVRAG